MILRARCIPVALAVVALAAPLACSKSEPETKASAPSAAPAASSAPAAVAAAPASAPSAAPPAAPPPCTVEAPIAVDKGARLDTGLTAVELENGKTIAIGYAVTDGTPKVAIVDDTGAVTKADVDWGHVRDQENKKDASMVRHLHRVTPLGLAKNGKMRVGMDLLDAFPEKGKGSSLRCGPADSDPIIADDGGAQFDDPAEDDVAKLAAATGDTDTATVDFRDCRTFGDAKHPFVVATQVRREGPGDNHNLLYQWIVDEVPGKALIKDPVIDKRVVKPVNGKYPKVEHFITPVAITMGDEGVLLVARDQGNVVYVRRTPKLERKSEAKSVWLGASAGMPSVNLQNGRAYVVTTELAKTDLYGLLLPAKDEPGKALKVTLDDGAAAADARDSASIDVTSGGDVAVSFVEGKAPNRHVRMTVLGSDLRQKLKGVFDVTAADPKNDVAEARVVSLGNGKFLVSSLKADGELQGQLVSCKY
jgi:hypothetical protein